MVEEHHITVVLSILHPSYYFLINFTIKLFLFLN